jgi:hypothetical protein
MFEPINHILSSINLFHSNGRLFSHNGLNLLTFSHERAKTGLQDKD